MTGSLYFVVTWFLSGPSSKVSTIPPKRNGTDLAEEGIALFSNLDVSVVNLVFSLSAPQTSFDF